MKCISKPAPSSVMNQQSFLQDMTDKAHRQSYSDFYQRGNPFSGDMTLSQTMPTSLLNHMMNCSQQQQRFPSNPYNENNESFYERNLKFNQHMQAMKVDNYNNSRMSTAGSSSSSLSAYESQMQQNYSMMMQTPSTSFFNRFDPPKPDTPPNKPLWLDPVWNCDGNFFDTRNSNGSNIKGSYGNSDLVSESFFSVNTFLPFFCFWRWSLSTSRSCRHSVLLRRCLRSKTLIKNRILTMAIRRININFVNWKSSELSPQSFRNSVPLMWFLCNSHLFLI